MFSVLSAKDNSEYLLLLGADILLRERAIVSALRTYPGPVVGMSPSLENANRFYDHVLRADYYDAEGALAAVRRYELETGRRPAAVVPILEMNVHVAVAIARHYELPSIPDECLRLARDKHAMKEAFEAANVPTARHRAFSTLEELTKVSAELRFPLVLKPRDFAGNVGTIRVEDPAGLPAAYDYCRAGLLAVAPFYNFSDGRYQAEEFVESTHEISVEVLNCGENRAVLAVTDKVKLGPPYFTELGQVVPGRDTDDEAVRELGMAACAALSMNRGIAHVEILVNGSDLSVVEVAARPGGDGIMDLIDRVYGFNPYDLHILAYRDQLDVLPEIPREPAGVGVCMFLKAPSGLITDLRPVPEFTDEELALYVTSKVGDRSAPASDYLTRNGILEYFERGVGAADAAAVQRRVVELAAVRTGEVFEISTDSPA
ncbi:MAG: ATP-grasp domain-containing protein [Actinomycetota bacterium]|nr:ATP-grasp domain-containing protein [Actinomycetota bacterium]